MKEGTQVLATRVGVEDARAIRAAAILTGRTVSDVLREAGARIARERLSWAAQAGNMEGVETMNG